MEVPCIWRPVHTYTLFRFNLPELEVLRGNKYDAKADLWSLGVILYELLYSRPPFKAHNHVDLLNKIEKSNGVIAFPDEDSSLEPHPSIPTDFSQLRTFPPNASNRNTQTSTIPSTGTPPELKHLIQNLLKKVPEERISFHDLSLHPSTKVYTFPLTLKPSVAPLQVAPSMSGEAFSPTTPELQDHIYSSSLPNRPYIFQPAQKITSPVESPPASPSNAEEMYKKRYSTSASPRNTDLRGRYSLSEKRDPTRQNSMIQTPAEMQIIRQPSFSLSRPVTSSSRRIDRRTSFLRFNLADYLPSFKSSVPKDPTSDEFVMIEKGSVQVNYIADQILDTRSSVVKESTDIPDYVLTHLQTFQQCVQRAYAVHSLQTERFGILCCALKLWTQCLTVAESIKEPIKGFPTCLQVLKEGVEYARTMYDSGIEELKNTPEPTDIRQGVVVSHLYDIAIQASKSAAVLEIEANFREAGRVYENAWYILDAIFGLRNIVDEEDPSETKLFLVEDSVYTDIEELLRRVTYRMEGCRQKLTAICT